MSQYIVTYPPNQRITIPCTSKRSNEGYTPIYGSKYLRRNDVNIISKDKLDYDIMIIKNKLNLNTDIWRSLPNDLLISAFLAENSISLLPDHYYRQFTIFKNLKDYQIYEFYGDAILELIITKLLFNRQELIGYSNGYPGLYTTMRSEIVRNSNLYSLMIEKNLCKYILTLSDNNINYKPCADIFESIIGVLFHYLDNILKRKDAFNIIYEWAIDTWKINDIVDCMIRESSTTEHPHKRRIVTSRRNMTIQITSDQNR